MELKYINIDGKHGLLYKEKKYMEGMAVSIGSDINGNIKFGRHDFAGMINFGFFIDWNVDYLRKDLPFFLENRELIIENEKLWKKNH